MFMQKINYFIFIIFTTMITFSSCTKAPIYEANITDLNGTWLLTRFYEARLNLTEEEKGFFFKTFSWGIAKSVIHTSFDIDISAEEPFFHAEGDGLLYVTEITQISKNSIKVNVYHGSLEEPDYLNVYIFHFIDKNTIWINNEKFEKMGTSYGKGALWHRISGPEESE